MTKALFRLFILFITYNTVISCSEQDSPELPDSPGDTNQGIVSIDQTQINADGGGFIIRIEADGIWRASSDGTWYTLSRTSGNGNSSTSGYMKANTGAERSIIITIVAGEERAEFTLEQLAGNGSNPGPDPEKPSGYAGRVEIPGSKGESVSIFRAWTTTGNGRKTITYNYGYDCTKKYTRWVALTFDNVTSQKNVDRKDAYQPNPNIPAQYKTNRQDYCSPYSRGHTIASSNRLYSREASSQTFYYSNTSSQLITGFNEGGGIWDATENKIQEWAEISDPQGTTYIVKGASMGYAILETSKYGVEIPKCYLNTVLSYRSEQYKTIGFYMEHKSDKSKSIKTRAKSADELESLTGLDFYHSLPDEIETTVKANYKGSGWSW